MVIKIVERILQYQKRTCQTHLVSILHARDVIEKGYQRESIQNKENKKIKTQKSIDEVINTPLL